MIITYDTEKKENIISAFLRFYVLDDYKDEPISLKIYGETEEIYTLYVTNRGWYSIDITDYIKEHADGKIYLKEVNNEKKINMASIGSNNEPEIYISGKEDEFDLLRKRFAIKDEDYDDLNLKDVKKMIELVNKNADKLLSELDLTGKSVFKDLPLNNSLREIMEENNFRDIEGSVTGEVQAKGIAINNARNSYLRLKVLLNAYHTKGSGYYHDMKLYNSIKDGLRLLHDISYNPKMPENGNWWPWEIGIPKSLGEIVLTMYDDLSPKDRMDYLYTIYRFQPNPKYSFYNRNTEENITFLPHESVGANRVDTCTGDLLLGIATKNPYLIKEAVDALDAVYEYVEEKDGFYRDGSFVQHGHIAYTTGYGIVLIEGLIDLYSKLNESSFRITSPSYENVYDWLENSFIPMVYNGEAFHITGGRGITRQNGNDEWGETFSCGYKIARLLLAAAKYATNEKREKFLSVSRRFMEKNKIYNVKENAINITMLKEYQELKKINISEPHIISKVYPNMDRVVHIRNNYAVALSMYSSRIKNFEMMNGENLKGWNQGNGALYLLNEECGQYDNAFWPTVDSYHLAGTTVDEVERLSENFREEFFMDSDFVGGVTFNNLVSVAAMKLAPPIKTEKTAYDTSLRACKSWFFFDDEIIALGSGINSEDSRKIKTVIENRMIKNDSNNRFMINDKEELTSVSDREEEFNNVRFAHLAPSIGYYFPNPVTVVGIREKRIGSWNDINKDCSNKPIERFFLKLWIEHGINPKNESYTYALLPGKTAEQTKDYALNPGFMILENNEKTQAVFHKDLRILAANVFDKHGFDFGKVSVDKPCSFVYKEEKESCFLAISDPTMKLVEPVKIVINKEQNLPIVHMASLEGTGGKTKNFCFK